jgi:PhzF family phenazine biosynthesis protein
MSAVMRDDMVPLEYRQVDVFAEAPLSGNGLAVIITEQSLDALFMQRLTCELRQFETIFLVAEAQPRTFHARVFTMEEELPFAGHPSLGAAAVLPFGYGRDRLRRRVESRRLAGVLEKVPTVCYRNPRNPQGRTAIFRFPDSDAKCMVTG